MLATMKSSAAASHCPGRRKNIPAQARAPKPAKTARRRFFERVRSATTPSKGARSAITAREIVVAQACTPAALSLPSSG